MLKTNERFHSADGKRLVLIVDDELINRELLRLTLEESFRTLTARDGEEALRLIRENKDELALIMLDLLMPGMHGLEVIRIIKEDPELMRIPVIVLTADRETEVESLKLGAVDFITKPYPAHEVILARVNRTIELAEDRDIIHFTERDSLTGLYNREYFFRYALQYDLHHRETPMDAIVVDVQHFCMINERYGKAYGDELLRRIGEKLREMVGEDDGIVCRREADTFLIYCPHREDYPAILDRASVSVGQAGDEGSRNRVRLRMGVYANVDKSIELERRFDRAKMASDTVRSNYMNSIAQYDQSLHESEIYAERLLEDFQDAIAQRQFKVFFQPKFDIRPEVPVLASAEALVRWIHPELGFISPGSFIPLFEENGLIQQLDLYVWRQTAAQIREWKDRLGICVPVSVNVSRVDMYDPNLIDTFKQLLREYGITSDELLLEITESAYTQDSTQIIGKVNHLRDLGFHIEMDDFGTGYSSLNMISTLPIDALKVDMTFIRNAFKDGGDTRLIEVIIDIAEYLSVPVIAEGVETEEQLNTLKTMGCDIVQGYYFSRPVPASEFEVFMLEKKRRQAEEKRRLEAGGEEARTDKDMESLADGMTYTRIAQALAADCFCLYCVDIETDRFIEFSASDAYAALGIEKGGDDFFNLSRRNILRVVHPGDRERVLDAFTKKNLLTELQKRGAFTLSYRLMLDGRFRHVSMKAARMAGDDRHIVIGVNSIDAQVRRRLEYDAARADSDMCGRIVRALSREYHSVYLVNAGTDEFVEYAPAGDGKRLRAERSGADFFRDCGGSALRQVCREDRESALGVWDKERLMPELTGGRTFACTYRVMTDGAPVYVSCKAMRLEDEGDDGFIVIGLSDVDEQMKREREFNLIRERSNRDAMTGVKSRSAYLDAAAQLNTGIDQGRTQPFAVAVCDVNDMKNVNDTCGQQAGDRLIQEAARQICAVFQHSPVYRVGGDEFVIILQGQDYEQRMALLTMMRMHNQRHRASGGAVIACGCSEWREGQKDRFEAVFDRADADMHDNKAALKAER